ncbi:SRPBCC family protein [Angustibacter sp. McL0619]|uniref:SRPBCC family protein n=1 Tax=Angustibacter sp. McL0619 TaxID=3415676 RepID=UPI003CEFC9E4
MAISRRTVSVQSEVAVDADEAYHFWNDRLAYPQFIPGLESVEIIDAVWSRWSVLGRSDPIEVETTDNVLHQYVAWRMRDQHGERVSLWVEPGAAEASALLRLEISWRPEPDAPPVTAQLQRAQTTLDRFHTFLANELERQPAGVRESSMSEG